MYITDKKQDTMARSAGPGHHVLTTFGSLRRNRRTVVIYSAKTACGVNVSVFRFAEDNFFILLSCTSRVCDDQKSAFEEALQTGIWCFFDRGHSMSIDLARGLYGTARRAIQRQLANLPAVGCRGVCFSATTVGGQALTVAGVSRVHDSISYLRTKAIDVVDQDLEAECFLARYRTTATARRFDNLPSLCPALAGRSSPPFGGGGDGDEQRVLNIQYGLI
ncbi:unnamed protein product [Soboliphyme baturini]|uniref:GGDEF domain-containing protein n=1 Tax=Soboliphyme baturini TaxID=241478 RepID=A0A183IHT2_9BILA|nr:unnamed protein product [Soboliphyme baturini]